jgi:hypothetical protein
VTQAPDETVHVHSVQEEYFYMMVHRCACGGAWLGQEQKVETNGPPLRHRIEAACSGCKTNRTFRFELAAPPNPAGAVREINPTAEPSRALDVAEWVDLAFFYMGRIPRLTQPLDRAQSLLDARQCLEEALKLYPPDAEAPPADALWSDASRAKVAARPAAYRRSALQGMLAKLPPMDRLRMADKMEQKEFNKAVKALARHRTGPWWQFWKRFRRS